jgi:uncharacterized glyoxalase superfamily metalloenzyme YdcJ
MSHAHADKIQMQHKLFAELSSMFGKEVPLYDKALEVNRQTNHTVCALLALKYAGFAITTEQLERTSGERHGAIRIGRKDEYRWVGRFFAQFAMEPHNFYDMTSVGAKSQPIIATAFRAVASPEHRVFTSLLMTDYFAPETQSRIEAQLAKRKVFSDEARALIDKGERDGGLSWADADALIREGTQRIFKWTGQAQDHGLYKHLCDAGFKIAADIACFQSHHLNHLTPNTFWIDLYTAAMKFCLGELTAEQFQWRASRALTDLNRHADRDYLRLCFRHFETATILQFAERDVRAEQIDALAMSLTARLQQPDLVLKSLKHAGFKDFTEGPAAGVPVLLRQDAYKALTEPVKFTNPDGSVVDTTHTARFGEIEQRFYATTAKGRALYDKCLAVADAAREKDPKLPARDFAAYEALYAAPFAEFPQTLGELLKQRLVFGRYTATEKGRAASGSIATTETQTLVSLGYLQVEGLRYEDFLPVSAAGIFASNLQQYGTQSTAHQKPNYTQSQLEDILGKKIIDTDAAYKAIESQSLLRAYHDLGLLEQLPAATLAQLKQDAAAAPK